MGHELPPWPLGPFLSEPEAKEQRTSLTRCKTSQLLSPAPLNLSTACTPANKPYEAPVRMCFRDSLRLALAGNADALVHLQTNRKKAQATASFLDESLRMNASSRTHTRARAGLSLRVFFRRSSLQKQNGKHESALARGPPHSDDSKTVHFFSGRRYASPPTTRLDQTYSAAVSCPPTYRFFRGRFAIPPRAKGFELANKPAKTAFVHTHTRTHPSFPMLGSLAEAAIATVRST